MPRAAAPAARISPDRQIVAVLATILAGVIMLASYVFSFSAITEAAAWTGVPVWAQWMPAVFIDGAIITYTLSLAIVRWRGDGVRRTMFFLGAFTAISVAVNFAHSGAAQSWDFARLETWFACLIGVSAPIAALFAADETTRLIFTPPTAEPEAVTAEPPAEPEPSDEPAPGSESARIAELMLFEPDPEPDTLPPDPDAEAAPAETEQAPAPPALPSEPPASHTPEDRPAAKVTYLIAPNIEEPTQ